MVALLGVGARSTLEGVLGVPSLDEGAALLVPVVPLGGLSVVDLVPAGGLEEGEGEGADDHRLVVNGTH